MDTSVHTITTAVLQLALDAASLRQTAHGQNIANAGSAGYQPMQVDFESRLDAARASLARDGKVAPDSLRDVEPRLESVGRAGRVGHVGGAADPAVEFDSEALKLAQNAVHFQALLRGVSKHLSILGLAAADGKR